jgi:hypothetical protein
MTNVDPDFTLDGPPEAKAITSFREQADQESRSIVARYENEAGEPRFVVISDRGTCVLLDDHVSMETFNQNVEAADIAEALASL